MKRYIISILLFLWIAVAMAVPAHQGSVNIRQPDGTVVTLSLHGDEYCHYYTTIDGYSVVKDSRGFYVYATLGNDGKLEPSSMVAHDEHGRSFLEKNYLAGKQKHIKPVISELFRANKNMKSEMMPRMMKNKTLTQGAKTPRKTVGNNSSIEYGRVPVILIEFNDKSFSLSDYKSIAEGLFCTENYSGYTDKNGEKVECTGSVRDYFTDNSGGVYAPVFDVFGPYKVNYSQYDPKGTDNAQKILLAAISMADPDINFKNYDGNSDGMVDAIYFVVAGNGANFGGNDQRLFWPHQSWLVNWKFDGSYSFIYKDGVALGQYASSVELYGFTSAPRTVTIDGIGTVCHEFSHILGLPDFYDTDYEGSGGESISPGDWSIMASGSYLNNGRTPIGYSLFERFLLDFTYPQEIDEAGGYELDNLAASNNGYYMLTPNGVNEYFMIENRQKDNKWNQFAPGHGMLVFRVDHTNTEPWDNWAINTNPNHNYYEMLRADGYKGEDADSDPFPGTRGVTQLSSGTSPANLNTWDGKNCEWAIENISESDGKITFTVVPSANEDLILVNDIALSQTEAKMTVGSTLQLTATVYPEDATDKTVHWESADNMVVTVNDNGLVMALAKGTTAITCMANDESGVQTTCIVTVTESASYPEPFLISVECKNKNQIGITTNDELQLEATLGNNGSAGIVRTMPVLIAKDADLNLGDLQLVKMTNMGQNVIGKANMTIVKTGEIVSNYYEASQNTTVNHTLSMKDVPEDDYYATVLFYKESENEGEAGWHCNISQLVDITVGLDTVLVERIVLSQTTATMNVNDTLQLAFKVWPQNATDMSVFWKSSDESVITVSDTGLVTANADGTAVVICGANDGSGATSSCTITVLPSSDDFLKGDVSGDGVVTGSDLVALTNIIIGKSENRTAADVNGDGATNGADYVALVNIILGRTLSRRFASKVAEKNSNTSSLHPDFFVISAGETKELTICLTNPNDELTLLQFNLMLPKGLVVQKDASGYLINMSGRTNWNNHQLFAHCDGTMMRFLLASNSNTLIHGVEGVVVSMTVTASEDFEGGDITLCDILGVSPDEQEISMPACHYSLTGETTKLYDIADKQKTPEVYNLSGQPLEEMKNGFNIVNGKKIIKR